MWNKGDEALYYSTVEMLDEVFPDAKITVVTHSKEDKDYIKDRKLLQSFLVKDKAESKLKNICKYVYPLFGKKIALKMLSKSFDEEKLKTIEAYMDANLIVSRGGDNWTEDYGYPAIFIFSSELGIWLNKKIIILGESIGPFKTEKVLNKCKSVMGKMKKVIVREQISYDYLKQFKEISNKISLFPDMAFFLKKTNNTEEDTILRELGLNAEDKTVSLFPSYLLARFMSINADQLTNLYADICTYLTDLGYKVALIPHVVKDGKTDKEEAQKVKALLCENDNVRLIRNDYTFRDYRAFIEKYCDFVVSGRMHPCLSSLSAKKPCLNLSYSHKSHGIIGGMFSLKEFLVDVKDRNESEVKDKILEAIKNIYNNKEAYSIEISHKYDDIYAKRDTLIDSLRNT